ncbi:bifunctional diaminohydroxyphosphoribosylaminopyrimidine deaminase/5-amino-6-(5-phosphoribosylamino)uracil reductase RibD [Flavobacteriaceae bacterium 3-367]
MQTPSDLTKSDLHTDEKYMSRCIELAKNGLGTTFPNPMVGCVIVLDGKIIGEGFTSPYGGSHAEVNAIRSVQDKSLLKQSVLYVSLEPCSHFGKTPPCADLIVEHGIPRVVIGTLDPNEKVAGKGAKKLQEAGGKLTIGVLEGACKQHHKRFLTFHQKKRPYIILKWAETADGFLAPEQKQRTKEPRPFWISNIHSRQLVHQWRSEEQAILIGTRTVLQDNPKLDVRLWEGRSPIRIVLDKNLDIPKDYKVFDGSVETIVVTQISDSRKYQKGIAYEVIDFSKDRELQLCEVLHRNQILSVIVEGGAKTHAAFIAQDLWDEARVFTGRSHFGKGTRAPELAHEKKLSSRKIDTDILNWYLHD